MIRLIFAACVFCTSMLAHAQQISEQQVQQAEAVPQPQPPGPGKFNDNDDYFIAQAQLASYSIDVTGIAISCKKAPPEMMDHIFRLQVYALYMAAVKSYGNGSGQLSLKGDHEFSYGVQLLNNKIDLGRIARKKSPPSQEQCNAINQSDYSQLISQMKKDE
ncbi:hypothetical protein [Burkholderia multivorans]|uniref:hypothetical protein n=1 Tax=Burkholderia multivorans TaxID=87883 RepID=UPI001C22060D|nr:hypothetical protein [Burkholderia multivorans]MBU9627098.1 hypothetical protein [Burkholderia multivorans]